MVLDSGLPTPPGVAQSEKVIRRLIRLSACVAATLAALACPAGASARVPPGFEETRLTGFDGAMSLAFAPDGQLLIAGRTGWLRIYRDGKLSPVVLDLKSKVCWGHERGMVGITTDPRFEANRHFYLYYTYDKHRAGRPGRCPTKNRRAPVNRVSRFTLGRGGVVDPASEVVLIDNIPSWSGIHNGGDLEFGPDGYLYVSVGDGGCDYARDSGCFARNDAARDRNVLLGKILRITRNGRAPKSNPFVGRRAARCSRTGRARAGRICRETWAWGLRNPFRFAFDPQARRSRMYINDTGDSSWEEVDLGAPGADYGWNIREGHCPAGIKTGCGKPRRGLRNPIHDYAHRGGCGAITGGAFVPDTWPAPYAGGYLYADYLCGKIRLLRRGTNRSLGFATGLGRVIDLVMGPYGGSTALFYTRLSRAFEWEVRVISPARASAAPARSRCGSGLGVVLIALGLCAVGARAASRRTR
jgi:glucose/arabinose dehydrogenase